MYAAQTHGRHEEPPARSCVAARYVGRVGVYLREFYLSTRQALLGRSQQPSYGLRLVPFDGIAVIVQAIVVKDAEVALCAGVARFGRLEQPFLHSVAPRPRFRETRG